MIKADKGEDKVFETCVGLRTDGKSVDIDGAQRVDHRVVRVAKESELYLAAWRGHRARDSL